MIESSFFQQYGVRLRTIDLEWDEFLNLLAGLGPETPLGAVVSIRSEMNNDVIKRYNKTQLKIWSEWRGHQAEQVTEEAQEAHLAELANKFRKLAKG